MGHASSHTFDPNLLHVMRSVAVFVLCGWGGGGSFLSFRIYQSHTCLGQREVFKDFMFESFQIQYRAEIECFLFVCLFKIDYLV